MTELSKDTDSDNLDQKIELLLDECANLKRSISRLSFVGMGTSKALDEELAALRSIIKKEGDIKTIQASIDKISGLLRRLDDKPDEKVDELTDKLDLLTILLKKELPKNLKKELKQVQKKSKAETGAEIVRSIANTIESYISEIESHTLENNQTKPVEKKQGFFASLFSRKKGKSNLESDTRFKENKVDKVIDHHLPQTVRDSLQHLIDQLSSMDGYSQIADLLNKEIDKINKIEQLSSILEMITGAFVEISDQEHVQFEKFLKTLNSRIVRVNDFISQTLQFSKQTNKDSKQLNLDLNDNLSGMRTSLSSSENLDDAKVAVFNHMDLIVSQVNQYCVKQQTNSDVLVSQMDKLTEQLRATEDEASRLKDDLAEQRVRAQTDPLTNLPNRYSYNERLTQEYNRWRRYRHALTLVICDIDLFKNVNDIHGHAFGDQVLKEVGAFLSAGIRESDFVARYGGEEFVILLPETGIVDATRAMNKMRSGISKLEIKKENVAIPISMSFGVSEFDNDDTTNAVFERSDKALYRAKEKGRNRVCCQRGKSS